MTRNTTFQLVALLSFVATIGYALDRSNSSGNAKTRLTPVADSQGVNPDSLDGADGGVMRLREGMKLVDRIGDLKEAGGRIVFYPEGETHQLQVLENLALERVSEDLDQTQRKWSVTGIVTEYRGGNYLLLHRAVLKARSSHTARPRS